MSKKFKIFLLIEGLVFVFIMLWMVPKVIPYIYGKDKKESWFIEAVPLIENSTILYQSDVSRYYGETQTLMLN